jgi:hypothetical protein
MEFRAPFIETQFEPFANMLANGRGADWLRKNDPLLFLQLSQAFAVAFSRGYKFGQHVGMNETPEARDAINSDLETELALMSKRARDIAKKLGVPTRNTSEMDKR